jgi:hypothetical protein
MGTIKAKGLIIRIDKISRGYSDLREIELILFRNCKFQTNISVPELFHYFVLFRNSKEVPNGWSISQPIRNQSYTKPNGTGTES